jgi:hypothetical protein
MNRRFSGAVVLGALAALTIAAVGALRHVGAAYGSSHSLMSGALATTSGGGHVGYSAGFYLTVLLVLAGADAVSLTAYTITQGRRELARQQVRTPREPEARNPDEWRRERRD